MKKNINFYTLILVLCTIVSSTNLFAQESKDKMVYTPAEKLTLVGKIMDTPKPFQRVDLTKYKKLPDAVNTRLTRSAGIAISFKTNSSVISAKWTTDSRSTSVGLTPIAYRGLDLYIKKAGKWQFAGVASPANGKKESSDILVSNLKKGEYECLLYLPIYSDTESLSIGVEPGATLTAGDQPFKKRILIYGSSIVQGAGASRPGMAYPARLSRQTGLNFLNLGTAAVAKMEPEVADMVADIQADAYILDCIPNSFPNQVKERLAPLITKIRKSHPNAPIIVMQSVVREIGYFDQRTGKKVQLQNMYTQTEVQKLQNEGDKNLYLLQSIDFLGDDHEGSVDGTHPNDLGFDRMLNVIRPQLLEILK